MRILQIAQRVLNPSRMFDMTYASCSRHSRDAIVLLTLAKIIYFGIRMPIYISVFLSAEFMLIKLSNED